MCDCNDSAVGKLFADDLLQDGIRGVVNGRCCLIENENAIVFQQHSAQTEQLPLTHAPVLSIISDWMHRSNVSERIYIFQTRITDGHDSNSHHWKLMHVNYMKNLTCHAHVKVRLRRQERQAEGGIERAVPLKSSFSSLFRITSPS